MSARLIVAALLGAAVACTSVRTAPEIAPKVTPVPVLTTASIAGSYTLVAIDGHALPFAPAHKGAPPGAINPEVVSSVLRVGADGTFAMEMSYRAPGNGAPSAFERSFSGTCWTDGTGYTMKWNGAGTTSMTLRGDTLVMNNEGIEFGYRRMP